MTDHMLSKLGEGVYWDEVSESLFWLDILNSKLFKSSGDKIFSYQLVEKASVILDVKKNEVYLANESGIIIFDLNLSTIERVSYTPGIYGSDVYRSNDGLKLKENLYIYGVMLNKPVKGDGVLVLSQNGVSRIVYEGISIPNTFIKIPNCNSLLITDSFDGIVYKMNFNSTWSSVQGIEKWFNLSCTRATPDGGCISSDGRIFLAIWDGFKVLELNLDGKLIKEFEIPIPRPTNCTLNTEENKLFITSAYEGLSDHDRNKYPLSGSILIIDINT
jgi:sugar lactone lactonase YvrE